MTGFLKHDDGMGTDDIRVKQFVVSHVIEMTQHSMPGDASIALTSVTSMGLFL